MKEYKFDPVRATEECVEWIKNWFEKNGPGCRAVVGISGGNCIDFWLLRYSYNLYKQMSISCPLFLCFVETAARLL